MKLESHVTLDIGDTYEKGRLNLLARERVESANVLADALTSIALTAAEAGDREVDVAFAALGDKVCEALNGDDTAGQVSALVSLTNSIRLRLDRGKPLGAPPEDHCIGLSTSPKFSLVRAGASI